MTFRDEVLEAQEVKARIKELEKDIAPLKQEQGELSGSARAKVTRKLNPLQAEHEELLRRYYEELPRPMSPKDAWDKFRQQFDKEIENGQLARQTLIQKIEKEGSKETYWILEKTVIAEASERRAAELLGYLEGLPIEDRVIEGVEAVKRQLDAAKENILMNTRHGFFGSTNVISNLILLWELNSDAKFVDKMEGVLWQWRETLEQLAQSVKAWQVLQDEVSK